MSLLTVHQLLPEINYSIFSQGLGKMRMCGYADATSGILQIKSTGMICGCKGKLWMCGCKLTAGNEPR